METVQAGHHQQQQTRGEEVEEAAGGGGGLLLLPQQLQILGIHECTELRLLSDSLNDSNARGWGIQSLCSLHLFNINDCPRFLSSYSSSTSSCFPFPTSLRQLDLSGVEGMETLAPLANLISLTSLTVNNCGDLRGEGLWPLVGQGHLTSLTILETPKFFTCSEPHDQEMPSPSSKLEHLSTDDLAGVLTAPICRLLSSSLTKLTISFADEVERFTEEQEEALYLLSSIQELVFFGCLELQCLPAGLTKLSSLKILRIDTCRAIQLLPKDGLPTSLQELDIRNCRAIKSLPKDGLPSSLQELQIRNCCAIKSLPKDGLPSSLRKLQVYGGISEELKSQCRKLKGTIPIIIDYDNY